jgi:anti-sigma B factor antagonist
MPIIWASGILAITVDGFSRLRFRRISIPCCERWSRLPEGIMRFSREHEGDVLILRLEGQLMGGSEAEEMRATILSAIEQGTVKILLDMEGVSWINSSGLGILIASHMAARKKGGALKLMKVSNRIESILNVTRLSTIFEIYPGEEAARRSIASSSAGSR